MAHIKYKTKQKVVPSVTTILGRYKNSIGLIIWSNKLGLEGKSYHSELNKAAEIGTNVHELAQSFIEGQEFQIPKDDDVGNSLVTVSTFDGISMYSFVLSVSVI